MYRKEIPAFVGWHGAASGFCSEKNLSRVYRRGVLELRLKVLTCVFPCHIQPDGRIQVSGFVWLAQFPIDLVLLYFVHKQIWCVLYIDMIKLSTFCTPPYSTQSTVPILIAFLASTSAL